MHTTYLCLLRGINVGGNNIIKMTDLKKAFEDCGFAEVRTYIQSGNVVFTTPETDPQALEEKIEKHLSERFHYSSRVVVLSDAMLAQVAQEAPKGFGQSPDLYRSDVIFIKSPKTPGDILPTLELKEGVDTASGGSYALYFSRLISGATKSKLNRIILKPEYQYMTIRNWNTTSKLVGMVCGI